MRGPMRPSTTLPLSKPSAMHGWRGCLLALALAWEGCLAGPASGRSQPVAESQLAPAGVVMGILAYTRWPEPARGLTLCITRTAADAAALVAAVKDAPASRPLSWRHVERDQALPSGCDIVFFDGWEAQAQRQALRGLADQPVLSIGWGAEFCSDGGLFCLESASGQTRFESNLDAVTRSGLRINAQVLRLTLPRKGAGT
jgi:hypothetical protein